MTNTTSTQTTETSKVRCGNCSTWDKPAYHATVKDVAKCFADMYAAKAAPVVHHQPVVSLPVEPKVIDHQPKAHGRYSAKCYKKGCDTHMVMDLPFTLKCNKHGKVVKVKAKQLIGTVSTAERHHCDSRCEYATGPLCTCSCGGQNHGVGFLIKI